jgi:hypothetical protein
VQASGYCWHLDNKILFVIRYLSYDHTCVKSKIHARCVSTKPLVRCVCAWSSGAFVKRWECGYHPNDHVLAVM